MIFNRSLTTKTNYSGTINKFSIQNSPIAFEILSTRLYKNNIMAIVREIISNAYESHISKYGDNASDVAIDIKLPSAESDYWKIRDYGTGLSKEDIGNIYTVFFASSKNFSNDFTGCFGLGSKTPFSYTKIFNVTSIYEGIKSVYLCVVKDGYPCITTLNSEPTNEKSGIEISIPVKEEDFNSFINYTKDYLSYVQEINANLIGDTYKKKDPILLLDSIYPVKIYTSKKDNKDFLSSKIRIKQGLNLYPVDMSFLEENNKLLYSILERTETGINEYHTYDNSIFAQVEVPIGTFDITPSREELSETYNNKENLLKIFNSLETSFVELGKKSFRDKDSISSQIFSIWLDFEINKEKESYPLIMSCYKANVGFQLLIKYYKYDSLLVVNSKDNQYNHRFIDPLNNKIFFVLSNRGISRYMINKVSNFLTTTDKCQAVLYDVNDNNILAAKSFVRISKLLNSIGFNTKVLSLESFSKKHLNKKKIKIDKSSIISPGTNILFSVVKIEDHDKPQVTKNIRSSLGDVSKQYSPEKTIVLEFGIDSGNDIFKIILPVLNRTDSIDTIILVSQKYLSYFENLSFRVLSIKSIVEETINKINKFYVVKNIDSIIRSIQLDRWELIRTLYKSKAVSYLENSKFFKSYSLLKNLYQKGKLLPDNLETKCAIEDMADIVGHSYLNNHIVKYTDFNVTRKLNEAMHFIDSNLHNNWSIDKLYIRDKYKFLELLK